MPVPDTIRELASAIRLLILDVDGVLTDGTLQYTETGELVKNFNAKDGFGIRMAMENGIEVAIISARRSPALVKRMADLKIAHFYAGHDNKVVAFEKLVENLQIPVGQIAYVGDDILDLPVMRMVGLPVAVGDAHFYAKENAQWVTDAPGGAGAVREVTDGLIAARTDLRKAYDTFLSTQVGKTKLDKI